MHLLGGVWINFCGVLPGIICIVIFIAVGAVISVVVAMAFSLALYQCLTLFLRNEKLSVVLIIPALVLLYRLNGRRCSQYNGSLYCGFQLVIAKTSWNPIYFVKN